MHRPSPAHPGGPVSALAFEKSYRGFTVRAFYTDGQSAHVDIDRAGQPFRTFDYPSYRIWNIAAHFTDMVDEFLEAAP